MLLQYVLQTHPARWIPVICRHVRNSLWRSSTQGLLYLAHRRAQRQYRCSCKYNTHLQPSWCTARWWRVREVWGSYVGVVPHCGVCLIAWGTWLHLCTGPTPWFPSMRTDVGLKQCQHAAAGFYAVRARPSMLSVGCGMYVDLQAFEPHKCAILYSLAVFPSDL